MLKVMRLHPDAKLPTVAHPGEDLAFDLYCLEGTYLPAGRQTKVRTGVAAVYEADHDIGASLFTTKKPYGLILKDRSSMAAKGVTLSGGVIDAGYRGELSVILTCHEYANYVAAGERIAQMIPVPVLTSAVVEVDELPGSSRGEKGFGSSGK